MVVCPPGSAPAARCGGAGARFCHPRPPWTGTPAHPRSLPAHHPSRVQLWTGLRRPGQRYQWRTPGAASEDFCFYVASLLSRLGLAPDVTFPQPTTSSPTGGMPEVSPASTTSPWMRRAASGARPSARSPDSGRRRGHHHLGTAGNGRGVQLELGVLTPASPAGSSSVVGSSGSGPAMTDPPARRVVAPEFRPLARVRLDDEQRSPGSRPRHQRVYRSIDGVGAPSWIADLPGPERQ